MVSVYIALSVANSLLLYSFKYFIQLPGYNLFLFFLSYIYTIHFLCRSIFFPSHLVNNRWAVIINNPGVGLLMARLDGFCVFFFVTVTQKNAVDSQSRRWLCSSFFAMGHIKQLEKTGGGGGGGS